MSKNVESNKLSLQQAPSVCPSRKKARSKLRYEYLAALVQIFFVPATRFRLLFQGCRTRHVQQKMPFRTSFLNYAESLNFLFGGELPLAKEFCFGRKGSHFPWGKTAKLQIKLKNCAPTAQSAACHEPHLPLQRFLRPN